MKKIYALILLTGFFATTAFGQQLVELYEYGQTTDLAGTKFTHTGAAHQLQEVSLEVKNVSGSTKDINVRRYETNVITGTRNYFCWSICYSPKMAGAEPVWEAPAGDTVTLGNGSIWTNFHVYIIPQNMAGVQEFRFVFFDFNNPGDSVYIDIEFDVAVGIEEDLGNQIGLSVYPNPANDLVYLRSETNLNESLNMSIRDMRGALVRENRLNGITADGQMIDLNGLDAGVYMLTITGESGTATRKIVKY